MPLTTKCEHRFRDSPKRKRSTFQDFAQSTNTVRTRIPRTQSGMDGWGSGFPFQSERRNQEWSISRAARTFSRPRNNRSKARTELFIFQKIQDRRRPACAALFLSRKSLGPRGPSRLFPPKKKVGAGLLFHCVCRVPAWDLGMCVRTVFAPRCKKTGNDRARGATANRGIGVRTRFLDEKCL